MIFAGPCLVEKHTAEYAWDTARDLAKVQMPVVYRAKLWGGGTLPERVRWGIGAQGLSLFRRIKEELSMDTATEIQTINQYATTMQWVDWYWIGARNAQNYGLLRELAAMWDHNRHNLVIKRGPGMTWPEAWGIIDIARSIGLDPMLCERGINTFCRTEGRRWMLDVVGIADHLLRRPDIALMVDVSHSVGDAALVGPAVKAVDAVARSLGKRVHYMIECYRTPMLAETDKAQAISVDNMRQIFFEKS